MVQIYFLLYRNTLICTELHINIVIFGTLLCKNYGTNLLLKWYLIVGTIMH